MSEKIKFEKFELKSDKIAEQCKDKANLVYLKSDFREALKLFNKVNLNPGAENLSF